MNHLHQQSSLDAFRELDGKEDQQLEEVWQRVEDGSRDLVALRFTAGVLTFAVDPDTDTVEVRCEEIAAFDAGGLVRADALAPWPSLIGRPFGWGWVAINQQGYQDSVLLSFGGFEPSVLLVAAAASLRVFAVKDPGNGSATAAVRIGRVDDHDAIPNPLNDKPLRFREVRPGDKPGSVFVVFDGERAGIWKHSCEYGTDEATAVKVEAFCNDRATRRQPYCRRDIEEIFGPGFN